MDKRKESLAFIQNRHQKAVAQRDACLDNLRMDNEFCRLEANLDTLLWQSAKNKAYEQNNEQTEKQIAQATTELKEYLHKKDLTLDCLNVQTFCPICKDSGKVDNNLCQCAEKVRVALVSEQLAWLDGVPNSFAQIDFDFYGKNTQHYKKCAAFLQSNITSEDKSFITIIGSTGVGKTFLAQTALKQALHLGQDINFFNAISLNKVFLDYHCALLINKKEIWDKVIASDILLIDDLGVEQTFNNVTIPYLYQLLVDRLGKKTIFTSNLELRDLETKYGQRILSRLCDKRNAVVLPVQGQDLRFV